LTEGQEVKTEQATYKAAVDQQEAGLAKAKATEANAAQQLRRGEDLVHNQNIPQARVDQGAGSTGPGELWIQVPLAGAQGQRVGSACAFPTECHSNRGRMYNYVMQRAALGKRRPWERGGRGKEAAVGKRRPWRPEDTDPR
jgi:hypothetical protein